MRSATTYCHAIAFSFARGDSEAVGIDRSDASAGPGFERQRCAVAERHRYAVAERDCYAGAEHGSEPIGARKNSRPPVAGGGNEAYSILFSVWVC